MSNIFKTAIEKVSNGSRFSVNFKTRSLKVGRKYLIKDGECNGDFEIPQTENALDSISRLFVRYQHSLPSERSDRKRKTYFIALPEHKLSDEDMMYGEPREIAQIKLELYVLAVIINGTLKWSDFAAGKWFWESPEHKELILLREWFEQQ